MFQRWTVIASMSVFALLGGAGCAFTHPITGFLSQDAESESDSDMALASLAGLLGSGGAVAGVGSASVPETIAGLSVFLQLDSLGLSDGQPASGLAGQSIGGYTLSSSSWPLFSSTAFNGHPGLVFTDNPPNPIDIDVTGLTYDGFTVFVALQHNASILAALVQHGQEYTNGSWMLLMAGDSATLEQYPEQGTDSAAIGDATGQHVISAVSVPNDVLRIYCDGTLHQENPAFSSPLNNGDMRLGSNLETSFEGTIAEFIIYDRVLSDVERTAVENYLLAKYGLVAGGCPIGGQ
jgi:hypothetical protein